MILLVGLYFGFWAFVGQTVIYIYIYSYESLRGSTRHPCRTSPRPQQNNSNYRHRRMPSTKRRHEYTFPNTTTREDFVGEASEANKSNTTPDEARVPSDTLFPNLEGGKGHDDVAGRRRSKANRIHLNPGPKGLGPTTRHHATDPSPRSPGRRKSILLVARWDRGKWPKRPPISGPWDHPWRGQPGHRGRRLGSSRNLLLAWGVLFFKNLNRFGILAGNSNRPLVVISSDMEVKSYWNAGSPVRPRRPWGRVM